MVDEKQSRKGIAEIRYIDPKFIKKVRVVEKDKANQNQRTEGLELVKRVQEYFIYNEAGVYPGLTGISGPGVQNSQGLKVAPDSIAYVTSGIFNPTTKQVYGFIMVLSGPFLVTLEGSKP